ncbi:MAG: CD225/dispanin family protein [Coriobacteriia bacterium]|nr:CD225/dispanin family protein [Coriobacteriia bacterium]
MVVPQSHQQVPQQLPQQPGYRLPVTPVNDYALSSQRLPPLSGAVPQATQQPYQQQAAYQPHPAHQQQAAYHQQVAYHQQATYQQPQQWQPQEHYTTQNPPANRFALYLVLGIFSLLVCGWVFAIPALVSTAMMNKAHKQGDFGRFRKKRTVSRVWLTVALSIGLLANLLYIIVMLSSGSTPSGPYW